MYMIYMILLLGDQTVNVFLRRFELSIKLDGWRGNVEEAIALEMKDEEVESQAMKSVKFMSDEQFEALFAAGGDMNAIKDMDGNSSHDAKSTVSTVASSTTSMNPSVRMVQKDGESVNSAGSETNLDAPDSFISAITHK